MGSHAPALHRALPPAGGGQSASMQQALMPMQRSPHFLPPGQVKSHLPAVQTALPLGGTGHGSQRVPQLFTSVSDAHCVPHRCVPLPPQIPPHASVADLHRASPGQYTSGAGQTGTQLVPLHPAWPPIGAWQGVHDIPQVATSRLDTQASPQRWLPLGQGYSHVPFGKQAGVAPRGPDRQSSAVQQALAGMQRSPHFFHPALQTKPHAPASHVGMLSGGAAQGMQRFPHAAGLSSARQSPSHSCVPVRQVGQTVASLTQSPMHNFLPAGQLGMHLLPSHVTDPPPPGTSQGVHEAPQVAVSALFAQISPQRCVPAGQRVKHFRSTHWTTPPPVAAGQSLSWQHSPGRQLLPAQERSPIGQAPSGPGRGGSPSGVPAPSSPARTSSAGPSVAAASGASAASGPSAAAPPPASVRATAVAPLQVESRQQISTMPPSFGTGVHA